MLRRANIGSERGGVVATAVILIAAMLIIGLATLAQVDTQTEQSRRERVRESTFNYAEAALSTQIYILGRKGTGTVDNPYPASCGTASTEEFCPDTDKINLNYDEASHPDFDASEIDWTTWVRDNADPIAGTSDTFWEDTLLGPPWFPTAAERSRYDENADRLMWVRSEATVRDRTRAMVGLIRIEDRPVNFPGYGLLAGKFRTTNNGKHSDVIVNATGSLGVQVRCDEPTIPSTACLNYKPSQGQISPPGNVSDGYSGPDTAVSEDDLDALMDVARANGTYNTSCPASLTGAVVVIDTSSECQYQGNDTYNSVNDPGLLILTNGKIEFRGTVNYHGLVYHANLGNSTASDLVKVHGNSQVRGGILVDGDGGVEAGSSGKQNILYNANAFLDITTFGTAGVVQNTWREITPLDAN